jgi:hypothetical protein
MAGDFEDAEQRQWIVRAVVSAAKLYAAFELSLGSLDLSRICAAPSARLGHLAFEGQGTFSSQC